MSLSKVTDLFDLCHEYFGVGGYDELARPEPKWYEIRVREAAHLNRLMKRRRVTLDELERAAHFCHRHGVVIRKCSDLFNYIAPSLMAWRKEQRQRTAVDLEERRHVAIDEAIQAGDEAWVERLVRATGPELHQVLEQWGALDA